MKRLRIKNVGQLRALVADLAKAGIDDDFPLVFGLDCKDQSAPQTHNVIAVLSEKGIYLELYELSEFQDYQQ